MAAPGPSRALQGWLGALPAKDMGRRSWARDRRLPASTARRRSGRGKRWPERNRWIHDISSTSRDLRGRGAPFRGARAVQDPKMSEKPRRMPIPPAHVFLRRVDRFSSRRRPGSWERTRDRRIPRPCRPADRAILWRVETFEQCHPRGGGHGSEGGEPVTRMRSVLRFGPGGRKFFRSRTPRVRRSPGGPRPEGLDLTVEYRALERQIYR